MKKIFKSLCAGLICLVSLVSTAGCSCSKEKIKINYNIEVFTADGENGAITEKLTVKAILTKKFAEPAGTPCYKRGEFIYKELKSDTQIDECDEFGCYMLNDEQEYVKLSNKEDVLIAAINNGNCYAKVYSYELVTDDTVTKCYTVDGEKFERLDPNSAKKEATTQLEEKYPIYTGQANQNFMYTSQTRDMPSNELHSYIYEFVIINNDSSDIYVKLIGLNRDVLAGQVTDEARLNKFDFDYPLPEKISTSLYAYKIETGKSITLKIEVKQLVKSDLTEDAEGNKITLNIPLAIVRM